MSVIEKVTKEDTEGKQERQRTREEGRKTNTKTEKQKWIKMETLANEAQMKVMNERGTEKGDRGER